VTEEVQNLELVELPLTIHGRKVYVAADGKVDDPDRLTAAIAMHFTVQSATKTALNICRALSEMILPAPFGLTDPRYMPWMQGTQAFQKRAIAMIKSGPKGG
jgi:hypothetical protein